MYLGSMLGAANYSCTGSICYGIGSYHQTLLQLQSAINRFVAIVPSLNAISVDGKIGSGTVSALKKIKDSIPDSPLKVALINASISKETAAASAASLVSLLNAYTGTSPTAPSPVPATLPNKPTSAGTSVSPAASMPDIFAPPASSASNKKWYALGALAVLGVGALAYWNYNEHSK